MKYGVVILSGAADEGHEDLDGATPLSAADAPNLEQLAHIGRVGGVVTTPPAHEPSSEISLFALLGYDPVALNVARGAVEAAGHGEMLNEGQTALRASFVCVGEGSEEDGESVVIDHAARGLRPAELRELLATVQRAWESEAPDLARRMRVVAGVGHRAVVIDSSGESYNGVTTVAPPGAVGRSWLRCLPTGDRADALRRLMEIAHDVLPHHEINLARQERGERPANMLWLWGAGGPMRCPSLQDLQGVRAAMVASTTVAGGVARLAGIDRVAAPGVTAEVDADLRAIGEYAASAVDRYDVVIAHVAAPDKAAHRRDAIGKTRSIEEADELVIGPMLRKLQTYGDAEQATTDGAGVGWRMLVVVDHITRSVDGAHATGPTPFVLAGAWIRKVLDLPFTEMGAQESDLQVDPGFELMEYALYSSLKVARRIRRPSERGVS